MERPRRVDVAEAAGVDARCRSAPSSPRARATAGGARAAASARSRRTAAPRGRRTARRTGAPSRTSSIITASAPFMSLAPRPITRSPSRRPGRLPWAGTVSRWPPSSTRAPSGPASTPVSPRSRASGSSDRTWAASRASSRDSEGRSISSSVRAARRSPSSVSLGGMSGHHTRMRFCGIDVSARPDNQQLCTLHERKGTDGVELVATFYAPGTVEQVARTIQGFGRGEAVVGVDAPSGRRLGLLGPDAPARADARPARRPLRAHARVRRGALPPRAAALPGAGRRRDARRSG